MRAQKALERGQERLRAANRDATPAPDPFAPAEALARACAAAAWFAALGEPPTQTETQEARLCARALGAQRPAVSWLREPAAVETLLTQGDATGRWWEREEAERRRLRRRAEAGLDGTAVDAGIERLIPWMLAPLEGAAARALLRLASCDAALAKVAAGAAAMAIQQEYLRRLAGAPEDHGFAAKFRLFLAGRWPLFLDGERLWVF